MRATVFQWVPHGHNHEHEERKLHILVSHVKCEIFPSDDRGAHMSLSGSSIDSYVTLVSSPNELLLKKPTKWNQAKFAVKKFLSLTDPMCDAQSSSTTSDRWPRTRVIKDTCNPDWSNRELHCVLKTQLENGLPVNLTGAILHIFVFKYNGRQTDEVVGSYPVNLEHLIRQSACNEGRGDGHTGGSRPAMMRSLRGSFRSLRHLNAPSRGLREAAGGNTFSININGPLLKNGKQTGVLRCSVDVMWLSDAVARAHGMGSMESEDLVEAQEGSSGADGGQEGSSNIMGLFRKSAERN
jgi:C2 domain